MRLSSESDFKQNYQTHLKHLKLKGLQPKTIEAYARAIRRVGAYFDEQIDELSEAQLTCWKCRKSSATTVFSPRPAIPT
jgi:integrase/recombinase XerD